MADIALDRKNLNDIARYAYGSGLIGEGQKGGRGDMGLLKGADGRLRVVKFNTHWREGGTATQDQIDSSNRLREQLLALARNFGTGDADIQRIRTALGLAADQAPGGATTLLTRKVVANVVKMIDRNIWTNIRRADNGEGDFDLAALKSRSDSMAFDSVRNENLGLETEDVVFRNNRDSVIDATVRSELAVLQSKREEFSAMPPVALQMLRSLIDELVSQWKAGGLGARLEAGFAADASADVRENTRKGLVDLIRTNFVRTLIVFGQEKSAKAYVEDSDPTGKMWDTYRPLVDFVAAQKKSQNGNPGLCRQFLLELGRPGQDNQAALANARAGVAQAPESYLTEDVRLRQELWERVDALPSGFLPEKSLIEIKKSLTGCTDYFSPDAVRQALDALRDVSPDTLKSQARRLEDAYRKASGKAELPSRMIDRLMKRLQAAAFVSQVEAGARGLTVEAMVKWFEDHPAVLLQVDRELTLPQDGDALQKMKAQIKNFVTEQFLKRQASPKDFGGEGVHVYVLTAREYVYGTLSVDGKPISMFPGEGYVHPTSGAAGTDSNGRQAFIDTFEKKIANPLQREFASLLLSMTDGIEPAVSKVVDSQDGKLSSDEMMGAFIKDGLMVLGCPNKRPCNLTVGEDGSVHLKMTVGSGLRLFGLLGHNFRLHAPLVNDGYEVEITIPKPGPDAHGCPDFTIDAFRNSDVDTQA